MYFIDTYNAVVGAVAAVLSAIFGVYWYLFAGYLLLHILDWGIILVAFLVPALLVNEVRSILENLVECGYDVPDFLTRGLAVTEKLIHAGIDVPDGEDSDER